MASPGDKSIMDVVLQIQNTQIDIMEMLREVKEEVMSIKGNISGQTYASQMHQNDILDANGHHVSRSFEFSGFEKRKSIIHGETKSTKNRNASFTKNCIVDSQGAKAIESEFRIRNSIVLSGIEANDEIELQNVKLEMSKHLLKSISFDTNIMDSQKAADFASNHEERQLWSNVETEEEILHDTTQEGVKPRKKRVSMLDPPKIASTMIYSGILNSFSNLNYSLSNLAEHSFEKFAIFSAVDSAISFDSVKRWGNSHFSPLTLKSASVCYQFPTIENDPKEKELIPFCFPNGVEIRIIPRFHSQRAKQLGWMGTNADKYQLHEFHDTTGQATHGISIIVKKEVDISAFPSLKLIQKQHEAARKAAQRIVEVMRLLKIKKTNIWKTFWKKNKILSTNNKHTEDVEPAKKPISSRSLQLAKESYETMVNNFEHGEICIVEQCYLVLGTNPKHHSLLFKSLQQLVDLNRDIETGPFMSFMDGHLEDIQTKINLTPEQEQVCHPKSEFEYANRKNTKMYEVTLNPSLPSIRFSLPLPHMTDFGLARLILKFSLKKIVNVLMLLLIEQPVLVIGHSHEEVSACTLALSASLKPYTWPNMIIPLLPEDILDVVSSPVPFIIGLVSKNAEAVKEFKNDKRVQERLDEGLTIIDLTSEKITWTTSDEINRYNLNNGDSIISYGYELFEVDNYRERLQYLSREKESSPLNSFKEFFMAGLSPKETVVINSIKQSLTCRLSKLSGMLSKHGEGWQLFVAVDKSNNMHFSPRKFYAPLSNILKYQRMFSQTQTLSCYFEERKNIFMDCDKKRFAIFVADWVYFHWKKIQKRNQGGVP